LKGVSVSPSGGRTLFLRFGNERESVFCTFSLQTFPIVAFGFPQCKDREKPFSGVHGWKVTDDEKDVLFVRLMMAFPFL